MLNWIKTSKCNFAKFIRQVGKDYEEWKKYRQD